MKILSKILLLSGVFLTACSSTEENKVQRSYDEQILAAGIGNGNMNAANLALLEQAAKQDVAVVRSSRVPTGYTTRDAEVDDSKYGFIASGTLNPQKARVLLQLVLTQTKDPAKIQQYFEDF